VAQVRVTYPSLSRAEVIERLRKGFVSLERRLPVSRIILFGSYAKDRYTAGSDIDIVVVYRGSGRGDAYRLVMDEMKLPRLEPRVYTEEQFDALMVNSPKLAVTLANEGLVIGGTKESEWSKEAKTG
jgi:predicted nucleotidyltransferase